MGRGGRGGIPSVHKLDGLVDVVHADHGENGSENLLLHQLGGDRRVVHNGGLDKAVGDVRPASEHNVYQRKKKTFSKLAPKEDDGGDGGDGGGQRLTVSDFVEV